MNQIVDKWLGKGGSIKGWIHLVDGSWSGCRGGSHSRWIIVDAGVDHSVDGSWSGCMRACQVS